MDYQNARSIRRKSLLSLIAERKFEDGQGIGSSIGGAISDKFKARATGFKEALDPLNFVRKLTGKGTFGDIAVTGLGRLFGRKDRDIEAFGGYGRKKNRGRKDPNFTTQGPGPARPLRSGDAIADILGKMYNFTLKKDEIDTKNSEIQKSFRQEQLDEDDRRHKELVEAIKSYTSGGQKGKPDKKKGNGLLGMLSAIITVLESAWEAIKNFATRIASIVGKLAVKVAKAFAKVFGIIKDALLTVFEKIWSGIKTVVGFITKQISKLFPGFAEKVEKGIEKVSNSAKSMFKVGAKAETSVGEKAVAKAAGKTFLKGIPVLGLGAGLYFGAERALAGDFVGAGLEVAGGVAGTIPGIGTAAEIGLGAAAAIHESNFDSKASTAIPAKSTETTSSIPQKTSSTSSPKLDLPMLDTNIPNQLVEDDNENVSQPVVAVNNSVKNIGGKPDKIQNTSPIKQRNSDLASYLKNIAVVV
jgi:hypothetical protein